MNELHFRRLWHTTSRNEVKKHRKVNFEHEKLWNLEEEEEQNSKKIWFWFFQIILSNRQLAFFSDEQQFVCIYMIKLIVNTFIQKMTWHLAGFTPMVHIPLLIVDMTSHPLPFTLQWVFNELGIIAQVGTLSQWSRGFLLVYHGWDIYCILNPVFLGLFWTILYHSSDLIQSIFGTISDKYVQRWSKQPKKGMKESEVRQKSYKNW